MKYFSRITFLLLFITASAVPSRSDDTCIFQPSATEVLPNIVLYIDNSVEMLQAVWHKDFDNTVDWTPSDTSVEAIEDASNGTGFFNEHGYGFISSNGNGSVALAPYLESDGILELDESRSVDGTDNGDGYYDWTFNGRTITLPAESLIKPLGVDNQCNECAEIRYSTNYLNWLFFSTGDDGYNVADGGLFYNTDEGKEGINRLYLTKQALAEVIEATRNKAKFALYWFDNSADGVSQNKPLGLAADCVMTGEDETCTLTPDYLNSINGMQAYNYTPLAEGLAEIGGYFDREASGIYGCEKNFIILLSPGISSQDFGGSGNTNDLTLTAADNEPDSLNDFDNDGDLFAFDDPGIGADGIIEDLSNNGIDDDNDGNIDEEDERITYDIPIGYNGSTYLDDVAYYLYNHDIVSWVDGYQNVMTYTVGFMGDHASDLFLINTSNNGNGFTNLYDTSNPDYGSYFWKADNPDQLVDSLMSAINSILERTTVFAAPVVPVTRTTSGNKIYMSFFTPRPGNFWEGNVVKFGLDESNNIVDPDGNVVTEINGALKEDAVPFWATIDWARDSSTSNPAPNGILYSERPIYTYLGTDTSLISAANTFTADNITADLLGLPVDYTAEQVIDYIRGADILDEDDDGILAENRAVITGDVLHSEPAVYEFIHTEGSLSLTAISGSFTTDELVIGSKGGRAYVETATGTTLFYEQLLSPFSRGEIISGTESGATATLETLSDPTMIFFGANDGMLHAVQDSDGSASWSFIPPNQLSRLKDILEGDEHAYFVDGSPRIYLIDDDGDGFIDADGDDNNDGMPDSDPDRVILVCGERKGSSSYFALDITSPHNPVYLWRISPTNDTPFAEPIIYSNLGESWAEPRLGKVKRNDTDTEGVDAMIIGGGFSSVNSAGTSLYIMEVLTANQLREFSLGLNYSFASAVNALDINDNGFIDKFYIGDLGGNMYRVGYFTNPDLTPLTFPNADENISRWKAEPIFTANDSINTTDRKFYYPPSVVLEIGYDLIFMGTGDREDPCDPTTSDGVFVVKDTHESLGYLTVADLINITDPDDPNYSVPVLSGNDLGWYYLLADGEKVLSKGIVFSGVYYFTTFTPNDDPCLPGGIAKLYAMDYDTGLANEAFFDNLGIDGPGVIIGGGIPSRPVLVINDNPDDTKLFISVGSTNDDSTSASQGAGIISTDPGENSTFSYIWWRDWVIP